MIGYIFLLIALILYFKPSTRVYSIFLYIGFLTETGFRLLPDDVIGVKNSDLAIIYTVVILGTLIVNKKIRLFKEPITKWILIFLVFLGCSWLFSYFHYGFSFYQILQASRSFFLISSFFILIRLAPYEINKLIHLLLIVTVITSILYIGQIIVGRALLPYISEVSIDESTGLMRFYNAPTFLDFFLVLSFVSTKYFKGNICIYRILFFTTLMCTLGRTGIFTGIFSVILALYLKGGFGKTAKYAMVLGLLFLPFADMIGNRFEKGGTSEDFNAISKGSYNANYANDGGTMTYRLAWVYERWDYLRGRPFTEQLFGLGFISDSQFICHKLYNFRIGLFNEETQHIQQLTTPDIAYGNILSRLGILGGIIYLIFIFQLIKVLYLNRKLHDIILIASVLLVAIVMESMSGSKLSSPQNFVIYFVACVFILRSNSFNSINFINNNSK